MSVKSISTRISIVGRGKCAGGHSAVEKSSYISRTTLTSEYDGLTYYPKYSEDLVHSEVMLPQNASAEYLDRAVLWNSVEMKEKSNSKAQLARSIRASLPNDWSYEVAVDAMRKYVKENFVDRGMCCEWAIHDSEHNGQRNLHCHILLTLRPILADGSWGDKQKKVYLLDEDGNKIIGKNGKPKCTTEDLTGWSRKENAKLWRSNLKELINETNEKLKLDERWDDRSFKEQGLDIEPEVHLGPRAMALEREGIRTEKGDINREIRKHNMLILQAKAIVVEAVQRLKEIDITKPIRKAANEITKLIDRIIAKKKRLDLPIVSGKFIGKVSDRPSLQSGERAKQFIEKKDIETFEALDSFIADGREKYEAVASERQKLVDEISHLTELTDLYDELKPFVKIQKQSEGMTGFAKKRFDREHKSDLEFYAEQKARVKAAMNPGEKYAPASWRKRLEAAKQELTKTQPEYGGLVLDLAQAEVISFNQRNYERELANERHSKRLIRDHNHSL